MARAGSPTRCSRCRLGWPSGQGGVVNDTVLAALLGGVIGASISGFIALATFVLSARSTRIDRQRQLFASAFEAIVTYREYPFIVRRRRADRAEEERQRISDQLSSLQASLNSYQARLVVECRTVGAAYKNLL